jgi:outer membrane receptor protein involved in Fe transport
VTASQYGNIAQNIGYGYPTIGGGNPELEPETARTLTAGIVFAPSGDLSVTVDYYDIRIEDRISRISGDVSFYRCLDTGDPFFCNLVRRDPATGVLFLGAGHIVATNQNVGKSRSAGADVAVNYRLGLPLDHRVLVDGLGSWVDVSTAEEYKGARETRCEGTFQSKCSEVPLPRWRHRLRLTWQPPGDVEIAATWRYIGSTKLSGPASSERVTTELPQVNYLDLAGSGPSTSRSRCAAESPT